MKMVDNNSENKSQTSPNPGGQGPTYQDWREQRWKERWEWRKNRREAMQKYPLRGLFPGLALILVGALFLANQMSWISGDTWWKWLLVGLGAIMMISWLVQYRAPEYRHWGRGRFVWGMALVVLGILFLVGFSQWWPIVIIGVGLACLFRFCW
jgi:phosphatidylserine synthase